MALRRIWASIFGFACLCALAACGPDTQSGKTLRLAHSLNSDHPVHKAMEHMDRRLNELSGGTMDIEIYPNGQLGSERELIELVQIGSVSMTKVSTISMEGFSSDMELFSIPYLFKDNAHYWRFLNSAHGQKLLGGLRGVRLQGLGYYDAGSRSFYMTKAPVNSPKDLKGLKVRVLPSRTSIEMIEALGGSATPISWGELYTALQQGVVDGAENNPPSYFLSKHYETAKFYTLDEHTSVPDLLIISRRVYDGLSEQQRGWLKQAVDESIVFQRKLWQQASKEALDDVAAAGVKIIRPDKAPFRAAVSGIKAGYDGTKIGQLIREVEALEAEQ